MSLRKLFTCWLLLQSAFSITKGEVADLSDFVKELFLAHNDSNHEDCPIDGDDVHHTVTELVNEMFSQPLLNTSLCPHNESNVQDKQNCTRELYSFVSQVLLQLNVTTECCLVNQTHCGHHHHGVYNTNTAEIYGYGFLMILAVSACALLGVLIIPMVQGKRATNGQLYKYVYALMIALGASALFCDAILHLIPEAFSLHGHNHSEEEEAGAEEEDQSFIWKGCVVIVGTYFFFLFETILHKLTAQQAQQCDNSSTPSKTERAKHVDTDSSSMHSEDGLLDNNDGTDQDYGSTSQQAVDGRPGDKKRRLKLSDNDPQVAFSNVKGNCFARTVQYLLNIKPLAWLIIFGDAIHNFADGLALGAAIAQSLSLGLSTTIALVFHEIPHELGDFAILLKTGMRWYTALFFNVLSQITGIAGFFVGAAISSISEDANGWILAIAAGVFLYIALVDLLPGLMHLSDKGRVWWGQFAMINLGFMLSFGALLLLAIFEHELNDII